MRFLRSLLIASVCLAVAVPAFAQQGNVIGAAKITNTARVPGTTYAIGTTNSSAKGVDCTFSQTAEVGTPSTVISLEVEDATSGTWQTLGSATAFAGLTGTSKIQVYPGVAVSSLPSGYVAQSLKVGAIWRLKQVITGGTSSTGTASCDLLN